MFYLVFYEDGKIIYRIVGAVMRWTNFCSAFDLASRSHLRAPLSLPSERSGLVFSGKENFQSSSITQQQSSLPTVVAVARPVERQIQCTAHTTPQTPRMLTWQRKFIS